MEKVNQIVSQLQILKTSNQILMPIMMKIMVA